MEQNERQIFLIKELLKERYHSLNIRIPQKDDEQKKFLRALINTRRPNPISNEILKIQDEYLRKEILIKGISDISQLKPLKDNLFIRQGDITTLKVDAIVNAANSTLLGCFHPNHGCIDNAIHTFAGIQLRLFCNEIMIQQGEPEKTGKAKITPGFNLPGKYIFHTVGPVIYGYTTDKDCDMLSNCYYSCLMLAEEYKIKSIAFCCISTGEFCFPNKKAAEIAIKTVKNFLHDSSSNIKIIFNVFKDEDRIIYENLL